MTQKELCYTEDAIGHEKNIIKICENTKNSLQDEKLISFIEEEIKKHEALQETLKNLLEEKANG